MNALGSTLIWCIIQVTLVSLATAAACRFARRGGPQAQAQTVFGGLLLIAALTLLAFNSQPRWDFFAARSASNDALSVPENLDRPSKVASLGLKTESPDATDGAVEDEVNQNQTAQKLAGESIGFEYARQFSSFFNSVAKSIQTPPETHSTTWNWRAYIVVLFAVGGLMGIIRLVIGLAAVRAYRLRAKPITDASLQETADVLLAELSGPKSITLCESNQLTTPATIGWLRPIIILPIDWRNWSELERRVVLSHEIAHIARRDYATWVAAQFAVVVHFYHPIIHWLADRLRLEQELAADAAAAQLVGGQRPYLKTLAEMALRRDDQALAWPARTFLPTRGTLMRRIERLRDEKLSANRVSTRMKGFLAAGLVLTGLGVSGLRGGDDGAATVVGTQTRATVAATSEQVAQANAKDEPKTSDKPTDSYSSPERRSNRTRRELLVTEEPGSSSSGTGSSSGNSGSGSSTTATQSKAATIGETDPNSLAWVPRDAIAVLRIQTQSLLGKPVLAPLAKSALIKEIIPAGIGTPVDKITEATVIFLAPAAAGPNFGEPAAVIHRMVTAEDAQKMVTTLFPESEEQEFGGIKYRRPKAGPQRFCFQTDSKTVVVTGREDALRRLIVAGKIGASKTKWAEKWTSAPSRELVLYANVSALQQHVGPGQPGIIAPAAAAPQTPDQVVASLLRLCESAVFTAAVGESIRIDLQLNTPANSEGPVREQLSGLSSAAQKGLSEVRARASTSPGPQAEMSLRSADLLDSLLDTLVISTGKNQVNATATLDAEQTAGLASLILPSVNVSRAAAHTTQSKNNLKQIGLALHNYYEAHQSFPPAVVIGPDGKTPHSWRVAILPYLEQAPLYEQYRKDEPWNGPNNIKLVDKIPALFRDPTDAPNSTAASYFALVGGSSIFSGKEGMQFPQITDGLSNTILVVEAKRDIPWTKPEDIPFDKDKPAPKFGGHHPGSFLAVLGDGSVRAFPDNLPNDILKALISRDGGELIDWDIPGFKISPQQPPLK